MPRPTVLSYYFPNYHPTDTRNARVHGPGWSEWELVKHAKPRFPGHFQPRIPAWGYEDESDPAVMSRKIALAAGHGIDAFIFDWYWYDDGPFLERCLEEGYLRAPNRDPVKFCCMWANHDWHQIHPIRRSEAPGNSGHPGPRTLYPGTVTPETFVDLTNHLIARYFADSACFTVAGAPYFSVYELGTLVASFGDVPTTRAALDQFRARCVEAGHPGLHLNAVVWGQPLLPGESTPADPWCLVRDLGFDSVTSYIWIHYGGLDANSPTSSYDACLENYLGWWQREREQMPVPYFPNITVGWDSSPRCLPSDAWQPDLGYPYTSVLNGNSPEAFRRACERVLQQQRRLGNSDIITVNCWNEWTEGSYLEPDTVNGTAYLEALQDGLADGSLPSEP